MIKQTTNKLAVTLVKSTNKKIKKHKACVLGLGLRKIGQMVILPNTPEIIGMINKVNFLLKVERL